MNLHTRAPLIVPAHRPLVNPFVHPPAMHPSCILALLPQWDGKWVDYSGRGGHGVVHGATPTAKGPHGFAYSFDGVHDYISLDAARLDYNLMGSHNTSTIVLWVVLAQPTPGWDMVLFLQASDPAAAYVLAFTDFNQGFMFHPNATTHTTPPIAPNTLCPLVCTVDGVHSRMFLGRVEVGTATPYIPINTNVFMELARRPMHPPLHWHGQILKCTVYTQAWSPNPADPNYLPEIDPGPPPYNW